MSSLAAALEHRDRANQHIIDSLAHYEPQMAMHMILSWISIADLEKIAPTLAGAPIPEHRTYSGMRAVAEFLGFEPDNHHNAARCPYCQGAHG